VPRLSSSLLAKPANDVWNPRLMHHAKTQTSKDPHWIKPCWKNFVPRPPDPKDNKSTLSSGIYFKNYSDYTDGIAAPVSAIRQAFQGDSWLERQSESLSSVSHLQNTIRAMIKELPTMKMLFDGWRIAAKSKHEKMELFSMKGKGVRAGAEVEVRPLLEF